MRHVAAVAGIVLGAAVCAILVVQVGKVLEEAFR